MEMNTGHVTSVVDDFFARLFTPEKKQSILEQALQGVDNPLEIIQAILLGIEDTLSARPDAESEEMEQAIYHISRAQNRLRAHAEFDSEGSDSAEHKRADDKHRVTTGA